VPRKKPQRFNRQWILPKGVATCLNERCRSSTNASGGRVPPGELDFSGYARFFFPVTLAVGFAASIAVGVGLASSGI